MPHLLAGFALFLAVSLAVWIIAFPANAGFNGLVLVGGLAVLGFIAFYVLAANVLSKETVGRRASWRSYPVESADPKIFMSVLDAAPDAYLIARRDGPVIYANRACEELARVGNWDRNLRWPVPLERVFAGKDGVAAPLYRLARAAKLGQTAHEILRLETAEGEMHRMRVNVAPMVNHPDHVVWHIAHDPLSGSGGSATAHEARPVADESNFVKDVSEQGATGAAYAGPRLDRKNGPVAEPSVSRERFAHLFATSPVGIALVDDTGAVRQWNSAFEVMTRTDVREAMMLADMVSEKDRSAVQTRIKAVAQGETVSASVEAHMQGDKGAHVHFYASALGERENGMSGSAIVYLIDMTEQKTLELQYAQSQKLQAVGQLAGGIAHDFNNLLTAIIGFCDLLLARHQVGDPSFSDIDQIRQNARRAANLVGQLLAFSRKQTLTPKVLSPTDVLTDISMLLRRLLGETIELELSHGRDLGLIKVDQSQFDTALINLAVNARDAMLPGSKLVIESSNFVQPESRAAANELVPPGDYVLIRAKDTGSGIKQEDLEKIFEPFFTTKKVGEGTGLGLSTVYGIIKQMDGYIFAESELGVGTAFNIYLPVYDETEENPRPRETQAAVRDLTGIGTILLVEDEDAVRAFARRALENRGYYVLEAANGDRALDIMKGHEGAIDLVVSDVVMPGMDGPTLAGHVRELRPDTKIIFISGYAQDAFENSVVPAENMSFLAKPFSLKQLAARVKEVLGE